MIATMPRPLTFPIKKLIGFDPELWKRIQEYRFKARVNTESDAIRELIEAGLGKAKAATRSSGNDPGNARKPRSAGKSAPSRARKPAPKAKALPMSKEAQIRALREQDAG